MDAPGKVNRPVMHGLVGVRDNTPSGWEGTEYVLRIGAFRGHPVMGSKLYFMGIPTVGKLVGKSSWM